MNKMRWTLTTAGLIAACVLGVNALKVARATPPAGIITNVILAAGTVDEFHVNHQTRDWGILLHSRGTSDAYFQYVRVAPGGHSGWHSHPGPSFGVVKSGVATFYDADDPTRTPRVYPTGTTFVDEPDSVHILRNEGATDLELYIFYLIPEGEPRRIDESQPPHYPF